MYDQNHWQKKIADYQNEKWSKYPSPFAQVAAQYFKANGTVLELGTGAGQDGLWLETQGFDVTMSDAEEIAFNNIATTSISKKMPIKLDITQPLPFNSESFDVVYAQLVLHYFEDEVMHKILNEIYRVLAKDGVLAFMVNTVEDPEYKETEHDGTGIIRSEKLLKRYFNVSTLAPFVSQFRSIIFDADGRTPKDDKVGNSGMVRFIGRKTST